MIITLFGLPEVMRWFTCIGLVAAAADGAGEVSADPGRVHHQFRRGVPGNTSPEPGTVLEDPRRHPVAALLADVWRTLSRRRIVRNGSVSPTCIFHSIDAAYCY